MNSANLLPHAFERWSALLGSEFVRTDEATRKLYAATCGVNATVSDGVLLPSTVEEIQLIVGIANAFRIPLYPISRGKNWGYGSACPVTDCNVILDLSRMNRILEVNTELAYAVVEPGVTQAALYEYLNARQIPLSFDVTGSSPDASILGNTLERGFGLTPYGDHFLNCAGMEVVLADGTLLHTGHGRSSDSKCAHLYKWGCGPFIDGIFTQSNMGIVTKLGIWLLPKPKQTTLLSIPFVDDEHLCKGIGLLRDLKLRGVLQGAIHIPNDVRAFSCYQSYPIHESGGTYPLSDELHRSLQKRWNVHTWNCIAGLWGTESHVRAALKEIRRTLKGVGKVTLTSPPAPSSPRLRIVRKIMQPFRRTAKGQSTREGIAGLLMGIPSSTALRGMYWRKGKIPHDLSRPDHEGTGLLWCSPIVPTTPGEIRKFIELTRALCAQFLFETNVTISLLAERASCCTVAISFDREDPQQTENASLCHEALLRAYVDSGFYPYRLGSDLANVAPILFRAQSPYLKVCRALKHSLDPNNIFAPGRYGL